MLTKTKSQCAFSKKDHTHTRPNTLSILLQAYVWRLVVSAVTILSLTPRFKRAACGVSRRPTALAVSLAQ
jgi:hypothetical protein